MAGRPDNRHQEDIRLALLTAAQELFLSKAYEQVTTRALAEQAGANPAMIRYYFGNKENLYHEAIRELSQPIQQAITKFERPRSIDDVLELFQTYYEIAQKEPRLPKLITQNLLGSGHPKARQYMLDHMLKPGFSRLARGLKNLQQQGLISSEYDIRLLVISILSLCIHPMISAPLFANVLNTPIDKEMFQQLAILNKNLFLHGVVTSQKESNNNE